ncbi:MAG: hypothetical protein NT154_21175 [Verrucomicrobia bacterium]|nr:hypothetical protein [Verrucomicrobiota bacterium]
MGPPPGLLRGATGNTPSLRAEYSSAKGGWLHRKLFNCNALSDKPKAVSQCPDLKVLPDQPGSLMVVHPVYEGHSCPLARRMAVP